MSWVFPARAESGETVIETETIAAVMLLPKMDIVITGITYPVKATVDGGTAHPGGALVPPGYIDVQVPYGTWWRYANDDVITVNADWPDKV